MTDKISTLIESYSSWTISFDASNPLNTISVVGIDSNIINGEQGCITVEVNLADYKHKIIDISTSSFFIYSSNSRFPIYFRAVNNKIKLSNIIYNLFDENEVITIDPFVMCQQLLANYSNYNFFRQIKLLEYNAKYTLNNNDLSYVASTFQFIENVSVDECIDELLLGCESIFSSGRTISVLLSGGYDSRLNLAISLEMAKKYGNKITLWHEYKDEQEFVFSKNVAESLGIPLNVKDRSTFSESLNQVIFNSNYIRNNGPTYRTNIPRWFNYLHHIKMTDENSIIFGHGAEGHKGKYYNQIDTIGEVTKAFGVDTASVEYIAKALGLEVNNESQISLFDRLQKHSQFYLDLSSKIDFIHYHAYVANGYGVRTHAMSQYFDIPFPFLDEKFLSLVFSLPREDKEEFNLVINIIQKLRPEFLDMPFISANMKSLKSKSLRQKIVHTQVIQSLRKLKMKYFYKTNNAQKITKSQQSILNEFNYIPKSKITLALKKMLDSRVSTPVPYLRYEHTLQLYLFLKLCEDEKNISFVCK